jgi:hypothetical protein
MAPRASGTSPTTSLYPWQGLMSSRGLEEEEEEDHGLDEYGLEENPRDHNLLRMPAEPEVEEGSGEQGEAGDEGSQTPRVVRKLGGAPFC